MYNRNACKHLNSPIWKGNGNKKGTNCSYEYNVVPVDYVPNFGTVWERKPIRNSQSVPVHGRVMRKLKNVPLERNA